MSPRDETDADGTGGVDGTGGAETTAPDDGITPEVPTAPSVKRFDTGGSVETAGDGEDVAADVTGTAEDLPDVSEVDDETLSAFIRCVIYANVALLLVALGPMVWFFEGRRRLGATLLMVGILAALRTYQTYRAWDRSRDAHPDDAADDRPAPEP